MSREFHNQPSAFSAFGYLIYCDRSALADDLFKCTAHRCVGTAVISVEYTYAAAVIPYTEYGVYRGQKRYFSPESDDKSYCVIGHFHPFILCPEISQRLAYPVGITAEKAQQHSESLHIEGDLLQWAGLF